LNAHGVQALMRVPAHEVIGAFDNLPGIGRRLGKNSLIEDEKNGKNENYTFYFHDAMLT
jgi:hypothetical protein